MDIFQECLEEIRTIIHEEIGPLVRDPKSFIEKVITKPTELLKYEKELTKYKDPSELMKILFSQNRSIDKANLLKIYDKTKTVIENSTDLTGNESGFISLAISLYGKDKYKKMIKDFVFHYNPDEDDFGYLKLFVKESEDTPMPIRKWTIMALMIYIFYKLRGILKRRKKK